MDTCKCFSSIARRLYFHHRTLPRRCCRYRDNHDTRRSHACKYETANIHSGTRAYATCRSMIAVSPNLYTKVQTTKYLSIPGSRGDTQRGMIGRTLSNSGAVCQQDLHYTEQRDPNPGGLSVVDNAASTLLRSLPDRVVFMAAYGSGVLKQANTLASTNKNPPMIDFLIATDDPVTWHETNMQKNPSHYSDIARTMGSRRIVQWSQAAAGIYYNTHVHLDCGKVKYGVASTCDFTLDLLDWRKLYMAGRLHKPVKIILSQSSDITRAYDENIRAAIRTAMLILPPTFTETELFMTIASLSYLGDPRMIIGENRHKVHNIVQGQFASFQALYQPLYFDCYLDHLSTAENAFGMPEQRLQFNPVLCGNTQVTYLYSTIPSNLRSHMSKDPTTKQVLSECTSGNTIARENLSGIVQRAIKDIVSTASSRQTMLGIVSAGFGKALQYAAAKAQKWVEGLRQDRQ